MKDERKEIKIIYNQNTDKFDVIEYGYGYKRFLANYLDYDDAINIKKIEEEKK